MYRRCIFCRADLRSNETIEHFPIARRIAFDLERGRLWAVCGRCERWNLSPIEERWEALEECERQFEKARLRASTEQIALARLSEGLELVRVGSPPRTEFAAWRYGDQFGRRRWRYAARAAIAGGVAGGVAVGSLPLLGSSMAIIPAIALYGRLMTSKPRMRMADGSVVTLHPGMVSLQPGHVGTGMPWRIEIGARKVLTGRDGLKALRQLLPRINHAGASPSTVAAAVQELETVAGAEPERYLRAAAMRGIGARRGEDVLLRELPRPVRLALEMAVHEDTERIALEHDLRMLEEQWREAEELAQIADSLLVPDTVQRALSRLRNSARSTPETRPVEPGRFEDP